MEVRTVDNPKNDEPRVGPGRRQRLATAEYALLSILSNLTGAMFWWAEQKRWQVADQLEQLELQR
jgi:hypothetical protein